MKSSKVFVSGEKSAPPTRSERIKLYVDIYDARYEYADESKRCSKSVETKDAINAQTKDINMKPH